MFKKLRVVKALGHIGKDKATLNVKFQPQQLMIQSGIAFDIRLKMERGDRKPDPTNPKRVERSMNNSDVKTIPFNEEQDVQCTYYFKDGRPEDKLMTFSIMMVAPGGKNPVIFEKSINMSMHFGSDFSEHQVILDGTRATPKGVKPPKLSYRLTFSVTKQED